MPIEPEAYLSLSVAERRQLVADIKSSVVKELETLDPESTDASQLRRRIAEASGHPTSLPTWDEAKKLVLYAMRTEC